jgi:hypothetical protein
VSEIPKFRAKIAKIEEEYRDILTRFSQFVAEILGFQPTIRILSCFLLSFSTGSKSAFYQRSSIGVLFVDGSVRQFYAEKRTQIVRECDI